MVKFKISIIILAILSVLFGFFYYLIKKSAIEDIENLMVKKLKDNAYYVKEKLNNENLFYETRISEWVISNEIGETITNIKEAHSDKKDYNKKIEKISKNLATLKSKEKINEDKVKEVEKELEEISQEIKKLDKEILDLTNSLQKKLSSFIKPLKAKYYYLVGEYLGKEANMTTLFQYSKKFIDKVNSGEPASDIWLREKFSYKMFGVPIKSGQKVVASLYIGFIQTKKTANKITSLINTPVTYIYNGEAITSNVEKIDIQKNINNYLSKNRDNFKKYYNSGDISSIISFKVKKDRYIGILIPMKNFNNNQSSIMLIDSVNSLNLKFISNFTYWLPLFIIILFIITMIISSIITRNYTKPYEEIEIGINSFLDGDDIYFTTKDMGEAEGLARSINRIFRKVRGIKEDVNALWDDPIFVTELNKKEFKSLKKEKTHYEDVYKLFIKAHINSGLDVDHIKKEQFLTRLKRIEDRLKNIHKVEEIYFEVQVDNNTIKLHPNVIRKDDA